MKAEPKGVVVPLVSPLTEKKAIDVESVMRLVEHVVSNGCHPFVLGTTGEALSIPMESKIACLKAAAGTNAGRMILYAGVSGMCLEETIQSGKVFADEGADILVGNLPGYYPLPEEYMLRYFTELADAIPRPLMIYNITATTHMSIPVHIVRELSSHGNIIGLKDSERDSERLDTLVEFVREKEDFYYQLGWAARSVYALKAGADGIVPSTANAFPELYYKLYRATVDGDYEKAELYQSVTNELSAVYQKGKLLSQALPGLKVMLEELGICLSHCISPCYPLTPEENVRIVKNMKELMERIPQ